MTEFTVTVPGVTIHDDAAHDLIGQEAPLRIGGVTAGTARVVNASVTLDGLDLTVDASDLDPRMKFLLNPLLRPDSVLPVSLATQTYATDPGPSLGVDLLSVTYPADRPNEQADA